MVIARTVGRTIRYCAAAAVVACVAGQAGASPVDSRAFFDPFSPTLLTWETRGNGTAVNVIEGGTLSMPAAEYASSGITFSQDIAWVNDASATFNAAQSLAGTPEIAIPSAAFNTFSITFTTPMDAFGFVVVNNSSATTLPAFTAFNEGGQAIETVTWGAAFIDGSVGNAQYGFMGIWGAQKIKRVEVTKQQAIFDDFLFAIVPAPGAAVVMGAGLVMGVRRRR